MTRATRAIKITEQAHYQLRIMAARDEKHIWELIDAAVVLLGREGSIQGQKGASVPTARKVNKRDAAIQARAESDLTAQAVGRENVDYSDVESSPTTHVANLDSGKTLRAALRKEAREINERNRVPGDPHWKGPLSKPKDRKKE